MLQKKSSGHRRWNTPSTRAVFSGLPRVNWCVIDVINWGVMYHSDVSGIPLAAGLVCECVCVCKSACLGASIWCYSSTIRSSSIQPTNGDLIRSEDGAGGQSMGSRLNYLDTPVGSTDKFTVTQILKHTHTHTHPFCLEFFPVCLAAPLSVFLCFSAMLCLSWTIFLFDSRLFFLFPSYGSLFFSLFPHHNNSFLSECCGSISFLAALISPSTVVFILFLPALSSVVIYLSYTFSPRPFLLSSLSGSLSIFFCLSASLLSLYLHPSSCPAPSFSSALCFWVTSSILYGVPRDVSVISRSLISKSSFWQRTRHAEEHRHKAWRQLMRPHTPTATITRPLQHQVSSQFSLVWWTVGKPQLNNCS